MTDVAPGWTALVLAGQRPGVDPLAAHFGLKAKALIPVAGEVMLGRVLMTLADTPEVSRIVVLAQNTLELRAHPDLAWAVNEPRIAFAVSGRTISGSVLAALDDPDTALPVLVTTADNVMLTPATVSAFIADAGTSDVAVAMVERARLEAAAGPNKRTWLTFRGGAYTGANLFALNTPAARNALKFWEGVEQDRKSVLRLAAHFGPALMLKLVARRMTVHQALAAAGEKLGAGVAPVLLDDGRMGVDVDKLEDHALAERLLASRT